MTLVLGDNVQADAVEAQSLAMTKLAAWLGLDPVNSVSGAAPALSGHYDLRIVATRSNRPVGYGEEGV